MKILKTLTLFTLAFLLFSVSAPAQKKEKVAVFKGKVMRSDTKQPVPKVKILLLDEKKSDKQDNSVQTETDEEGNFVFNDLKAGKYTISIRAYFEKEEDVPCQLLMGKIDEPNSQLLVITEKNQIVEQIFIKGFSVKAGKEITKEFDLVCKSLFGK
jgi:hypothetical protein